MTYGHINWGGGTRPKRMHTDCQQEQPPAEYYLNKPKPENEAYQHDSDEIAHLESLL